MWNDERSKARRKWKPSIKGTSTAKEQEERATAAQGGSRRQKVWLLVETNTKRNESKREWAHRLGGGACWSIIRRSLQIPAAELQSVSSTTRHASKQLSAQLSTAAGGKQPKNNTPDQTKRNTTRTQARLGCADQKSACRSLCVRYNLDNTAENPASRVIAGSQLCRSPRLQFLDSSVCSTVSPPVARERTLADAHASDHRRYLDITVYGSMLIAPLDRRRRPCLLASLVPDTAFSESGVAKSQRVERWGCALS